MPTMPYRKMTEAERDEFCDEFTTSLEWAIANETPKPQTAEHHASLPEQQHRSDQVNPRG